MKKVSFINKLNETTGYSLDQCEIINDIMESHLIIGKKGQEKIINDFETSLGITNEEAVDLYENCVSIIGISAKNRIKKTFKRKKKEQ